MLAALGLVLASCGAGAPSEEAAAAARFCPVLVDWVSDAGASFNQASEAAREEPDPAARRQLWLEAVSAISRRVLVLDEQMSGFADDPLLAPLAAEVRRDVTRAVDQLEEVRESLLTRPEIDEQPARVRISQMVVSLEKAIDLPKPELGAAADPALLEGFREVRDCWFGVKDVDDGTTAPPA